MSSADRITLTKEQAENFKSLMRFNGGAGSTGKMPQGESSAVLWIAQVDSMLKNTPHPQLNPTGIVGRLSMKLNGAAGEWWASLTQDERTEFNTGTWSTFSEALLHQFTTSLSCMQQMAILNAISMPSFATPKQCVGAWQAKVNEFNSGSATPLGDEMLLGTLLQMCSTIPGAYRTLHALFHPHEKKFGNHTDGSKFTLSKAKDLVIQTMEMEMHIASSCPTFPGTYAVSTTHGHHFPDTPPHGQVNLASSLPTQPLTPGQLAQIQYSTVQRNTSLDMPNQHGHRGNPSQHTTPRRKGKLPAAEKQRRIDLKLCSYCGDPDHDITLCPTKPESRHVNNKQPPSTHARANRHNAGINHQAHPNGDAAATPTHGPSTPPNGHHNGATDGNVHGSHVSQQYTDTQAWDQPEGGSDY